MAWAPFGKPILATRLSFPVFLDEFLDDDVVQFPNAVDFDCDFVSSLKESLRVARGAYSERCPCQDDYSRQEIGASSKKCHELGYAEDHVGDGRTLRVRPSRHELGFTLASRIRARISIYKTVNKNCVIPLEQARGAVFESCMSSPFR